MQVRAAVVPTQGADFEWWDVDLDEPREDEVLVRLVATGLCHTDLTMRTYLPQEMFPRIFGHEGAGVVEQVGAAVEGIQVGDHVVMSFRSCRSCAACGEDAPGYCEQSVLLNYMGFRLDGTTTHARDGQPVQASFFGQSSLATHAIAYADNCVVVDPALDLSLAAPYGCAFQTGAGTVMNLLRPAPGQSIAVFGAGAVGLAAVAAATALGVTVVAVDPAPARLAAAQRLGALTLDPSAVGAAGVVQAVKDLTAGGPMGAIDTSAVPAVVKQAQQALATRGTLVPLGLGPEEWVLDAADLLATGKTVRSSVEGEADPQRFIPQLLELRAQGGFPLDDLVTTYRAADIANAVADVGAGQVVKPVLVW